MSHHNEFKPEQLQSSDDVLPEAEAESQVPDSQKQWAEAELQAEAKRLFQKQINGMVAKIILNVDEWYRQNGR